MSVKALNEWEAYYLLEPFGPMVDNLNFGRILTLLLNMVRKKGDRPENIKTVSFGDFGETGDSDPIQSVDLQKKMVNVLAAAFGGSVTTKEDRERAKSIQRQKTRRARRRD